MKFDAVECSFITFLIIYSIQMPCQKKQIFFPKHHWFYTIQIHDYYHLRL